MSDHIATECYREHWHVCEQHIEQNIKQVMQLLTNRRAHAVKSVAKEARLAM